MGEYYPHASNDGEVRRRTIFSWFAFFTMWSMANPALTEHVYQAPAPIERNYNVLTMKMQ